MTMRTERVREPNEPDKDKQREVDAPRPRRRSQHGPIGFGSVMRDVRKQSSGAAGGDGVGAAKGPRASIDPSSPDFDAARAQALSYDPGHAAALATLLPRSGAQQQVDASTGRVDQSAQRAGDQAQQGGAQHAQHGMHAAAQAAVHAPTPVVRMTPAALLDRVLDEATKEELARASKEIKVELEPVHLGPLVVSLRRSTPGRIDVQFRAQRADAARTLDAGSDLLRSRLAEAGFPESVVSIAVDETLDSGTTGGSMTRITSLP